MNHNKLIVWMIMSALSVFLVEKAITTKFLARQPTPSPQQAQTKMVLPINAMVASANIDGAELKNVADTELPKLSNTVPRDEKIFEEVRNNTHNVPASMLDFTVIVTAKMKQAKLNFMYADALFSEFGNCAAQTAAGQQNLALRAYCLANAKRLVGWYPGLAGRWQQLSSQVGSPLLELVDMTQG